VRTIVSHGVAELPPNLVDLAGRALETTLPVRRGACTVRITEHNGKLRIEGSADPRLTQTVAHMFRLDEDLSRFYELVRDDELAWCALGAGRMLRAPTAFEDVVKTMRTYIRSSARRALSTPGKAVEPSMRSPAYCAGTCPCEESRAMRSHRPRSRAGQARPQRP
jgi:hypothetical protein